MKTIASLSILTDCKTAAACRIAAAFLLFLCLIPKPSLAQVEIRVGDEFYGRAAKELERTGIDSVMSSCGLDSRTACAVVFPEMLRYHALRDRMEMMALKTLYVQYGARYANFSVGMFQMKPSFAEALERELMEEGEGSFMGLVADTVQTPDVRKKRLEQLSCSWGQVRYLALFMHFVQRHYPSLERMNEQERVRFYATAYNYSYRAPLASILRAQTRKEYHLDLWPTTGTARYNYADVAAGYYNR